MQEPYDRRLQFRVPMERINNGHRPKLADDLTSDLRDLIVRAGPGT